MHPVAVGVIFFLVWWVTFFAVLPTGVQSRHESEPDGVIGADPGAPTDPEIKRKMLTTTAIAAVITAIVCAIIISGVFNFRG